MNVGQILWKHAKYFWRRFVSVNGAELSAEIQFLMKGFGSAFTVNLRDYLGAVVLRHRPDCHSLRWLRIDLVPAIGAAAGMRAATQRSWRSIRRPLRANRKSWQDRLVRYPEGRAVLGAHLAAIIHARGRNIGMSQPLLDLGDISVVLERVGSGGGAQRVRPEAIDHDAYRAGIFRQHLIDAIGRDGTGAARVVAYGAEQRGGFVVTVVGRVEVGGDRAGGGRVQRHIADLAAFAVYLQVAHTAAILQVDQAQLAQLGTAQAVIEQGGQHGAIAQAG